MKAVDVEKDAVLNTVPMEEYHDDSESAKELPPSPKESLSFTPPREELEDDKRWHLTEPELPSRAVTLSRGTYEPVLSP